MFLNTKKSYKIALKKGRKKAILTLFPSFKLLKANFNSLKLINNNNNRLRTIKKI